MKKVIQAVNANPSQHALLESPTGSGKTLCMFAAILSWIYHQRLSGVKDTPKVLFFSRTHSQLQQVAK